VNGIPGTLTLLGAATLAPLWDYGLEIRHDNLLLAGLLSMWWTVRIAPRGTISFALAGALTVILQFGAVKAFLYTVPISLGALLLPDIRHGRGRQSLVVAWLAGAITAFVFLRLAYGALGWWDLYVRDLNAFSDVAAGAERFSAAVSLHRMLNEAPLLTVVASIGILSAACQSFRVRDRSAWYGTSGPEAGLLLLALTALFINPAPYPYNLVNLVPFCFLVAHRELSTIIARGGLTGIIAIIAVVTVAAGHLLPFGAATMRHFRMTNDRQAVVMQLAEDLTDPKRDHVYDGIGMVPTRSSVGYDWLLHSLNISRFTRGDEQSIRSMLESRPAAVFIRSYRTDWLTGDDHRYIRNRYIPIADDLWVLGSVGPPGGGDFDVVHPGRYTVIEGSMLQGRSDAVSERNLRGVRVNSVVLTDDVIDLPVGRHHIECESPCRPALVWLGPRLDAIPDLAHGDHRRLFVNWY
jgi:hypothetical protein